jgi:drug/metabolite transporter (DMT)-like permease
MMKSDAADTAAADTAAAAIAPAQPKIHPATLALLLATFFWGCGFTWAKAGGEHVNRLVGLEHGAPLGPIWLLSVRFLAAGVLWLVIFPASRRGWTWASVGRAAAAGSFLTAGLVTQHLGLDRGSEAVIAFLTSLTILFVPLLMTLVLRRPPPAVLWVGVGLATLGIWMMTGAAGGGRGFGVGERLGVVCAVLFSMHLISVNTILGGDSPARMAGGQFLAVGLITLLITLLLERGPQSLAPSRAVALMTAPGVGLNLALMILFVTIGAFGLQTFFQPSIDPTRAALLYLVEPIFAALYPWLTEGRGLTAIATAGALLILVANVLVELLQSRRRDRRSVDPGEGPAIVD